MYVPKCKMTTVVWSDIHDRRCQSHQSGLNNYPESSCLFDDFAMSSNSCFAFDDLYILAHLHLQIISTFPGSQIVSLARTSGFAHSVKPSQS